MNRVQLPKPEQMVAYLEAHGWHFARHTKHPGAFYEYHIPADDGTPLELFVPFGDDMEWEDYAPCVVAVLDTLVAFEERPKYEILAELLVTKPAPTPVV